MKRLPPRTKANAIPGNEIYRILVCRPNHRLGNMILVTPLIAELERLYKGAEIDIVAEGDAAIDVFQTFSSVRHIYCLPRRGFKRPFAFFSKIRKIRKNHYDLIIDPCLGSDFSRLLTRLFTGKRKLGFDDGERRRRGMTHLVPAAMAPHHMAKRSVMLVRWFASRQIDEPEDFPVLDLRLSAAEKRHGEQLVRDLVVSSDQSSKGGVIGLFAEATGKKRYCQEWWNDFVAAIRMASPECSLVEIIPVHGRSMLDSKWPGYYSTSIRRMASAMAGVDMMISADCGVMHLAVASGTPTIGMFSITDAKIYGPYGSHNAHLVTQGMTPQEAAKRAVYLYRESFFGSTPLHADSRLEATLL
ncbi:glycosyltransferase family 9 protein [Rhodanobacter sp. K2T2]|uniref:glycosyltransferase family 9 protein n=1 Tax=Rhodanobacter sp. K2T2 TaxID=2723085 RepID=UPI001C53FBDD